MSLLQKLDQIAARYAELQAACRRQSRFAEVRGGIEGVFRPRAAGRGDRRMRKAETEMKEAEALATDPDMKAMAEEEAAALKKRLPELERP